MSEFDTELNKFFSEFGIAKKMVLSTSENDVVSSRMMSVVLIDGIFYFQTDITMRKYSQIMANPNVALCIDNIQIQGVCKEIGKPLENEAFASTFEKCYKGSYDAYSLLKNERLFAVKPVFIERWQYLNKLPFIETFDLNERSYKFLRYIGE